MKKDGGSQGTSEGSKAGEGRGGGEKRQLGEMFGYGLKIYTGTDML